MIVPEKTLGLEGVEDARPALKGVGHPAGSNETPI